MEHDSLSLFLIVPCYLGRASVECLGYLFLTLCFLTCLSMDFHNDIGGMFVKCADDVGGMVHVLDNRSRTLGLTG